MWFRAVEPPKDNTVRSSGYQLAFQPVPKEVTSLEPTETGKNRRKPTGTILNEFNFRLLAGFLIIQPHFNKTK